ncbi:glyoxalase domain-containing protein 4-like [Orbicella faveolata]|uniref:glyoxalase domain-containing protein 4-like n=1 Tax=Orbicella faveolata TaxID=48498 RepID=UPI0009E43C14|nr:glyoxalase domain-containing protein 4-like [Orbicella faveolata]
MAGFGPEDDHFVVELTYNYGIKEYQLGNDFQGLTVHSKTAVANAKQHNYPVTEQGDGCITVKAPDGYKFTLVDQDVTGDPVKKVSLGVSDVAKSLVYWQNLLGMTVYEQSETEALLGYDSDKCKLELIHLGCPVDHATAFGRIAFSCPGNQLPAIEHSVKEAGHTILTPLVSLDTPGKATVQVVILTDPDGHEICFVGDEAFRELSKVDPEGDSLLNTAMAEDKSDEWFSQVKVTSHKKWTL